MNIESIAEKVHEAYLATCSRLGWEVKPSNKVQYSELSEDSKELDRESVRAVAKQFGFKEADGRFVQVEKPIDFEGIAHEIWVLAQLLPGEGIEDGADRIERELRRLFGTPGNEPEGLYRIPNPLTESDTGFGTKNKE